MIEPKLTDRRDPETTVRPRLRKPAFDDGIAFRGWGPKIG